jgi:hypothetical protein
MAMLAVEALSVRSVVFPPLNIKQFFKIPNEILKQLYNPYSC